MRTFAPSLPKGAVPTGRVAYLANNTNEHPKKSALMFKGLNAVLFYRQLHFREDCGWIHRIPTLQDHVDSGMDVFGRERFDEHRDDRGGVGSMRSDSRTLYIGRIHQAADMEATVEKHFKAWGEIERIKVLGDKGVAFVTYQSRLNAEFAKEAMANQSLDHGEVSLGS